MGRRTHFASYRIPGPNPNAQRAVSTAPELLRLLYCLRPLVAHLWHMLESPHLRPLAHGDTQGSGAVYVTGQFTSASCTFGAFALTNRGTKADGVSSRDAFVVKLRTDGVFLWAASAGGTDADYAAAVALDSAGNAFVAGTTFARLWLVAHPIAPQPRHTACERSRSHTHTHTQP